MWLELRGRGIDVARCTVEQLMKSLGLQGAQRGKVKRTTSPDPAATRAQDLVKRNFCPLAPNKLPHGPVHVRTAAPAAAVDRVRTHGSHFAAPFEAPSGPRPRPGACDGSGERRRRGPGRVLRSGRHATLRAGVRTGRGLAA